MWQAFELIHKSFKDGAELYLEGTLSRRYFDPLRHLHGRLAMILFIHPEPVLTGLKICYQHWTTLCPTVLR